MRELMIKASGNNDREILKKIREALPDALEIVDNGMALNNHVFGSNVILNGSGGFEQPITYAVFGHSLGTWFQISPNWNGILSIVERQAKTLASKLQDDKSHSYDKIAIRNSKNEIINGTVIEFPKKPVMSPFKKY
jgi:hypothetical protein